MAGGSPLKMCTACGADKFRYDFAAGSEVCRACMMDGDRVEDNPLVDHPMRAVAVEGAALATDAPALAGEGLEAGAVTSPGHLDTPASRVMEPAMGLVVNPGLVAYMRATMGLDETEWVDLEAFLAQHCIVGSARARAWWQTTCFPRGSGVLNLDVVRDYGAARLGELDELRNRAYEQGRSRHEVTVEDVSLDLAGQVLYLESYPEIREGLDIGLEV